MEVFLLRWKRGVRYERGLAHGAESEAGAPVSPWFSSLPANEASSRNGRDEEYAIDPQGWADYAHAN